MYTYKYLGIVILRMYTLYYIMQLPVSSTCFVVRSSCSLSGGKDRGRGRGGGEGEREKGIREREREREKGSLLYKEMRLNKVHTFHLWCLQLLQLCSEEL